MREIYLSLTNHPGQLSLAIPLWVGAISTCQRTVMLCDKSKGRYGLCLVAGKTVWSLYNVPYLSALDAKLMQLSTIQIHVYFLYFTMDELPSDYMYSVVQCHFIGQVAVPSLTSYASLIFINFSFASGSLFLSGCLSSTSTECINDHTEQGYENKMFLTHSYGRARVL